MMALRGDSLLNLLGEVEHAKVTALEYGFMAASMLLERPLKVDGLCSLSIFDGSGGMSIALALSGVPTICPWEVEKDERLDVIKNAVVLWSLARSGRVLFSWLAMPCRSWTLARKPMLRSMTALAGEDWVASFGNWTQWCLVADGNVLLLFIAMYVCLILLRG